jgi:hypothetical protein
VRSGQRAVLALCMHTAPGSCLASDDPVNPIQRPRFLSHSVAALVEEVGPEAFTELILFNIAAKAVTVSIATSLGALGFPCLAHGGWAMGACRENLWPGTLRGCSVAGNTAPLHCTLQS